MDLSILNNTKKHPLGVAVSGGGDSVALLHLLSAQMDRDLIVYHFDHGLQSTSKEWAELVRSHCDNLNHQFRLRRWENPPLKPRPSLVRFMRHQALAQMMEEDGVHILCLGHTLDDNHESALMRQMGSTIGQMGLLSAHPLWPEGRGKCYYRPLILQNRIDLRHYLRDNRLDYIDDPANETGLRGEARQRLSSQTSLISDTCVIDKATIGSCGYEFSAETNGDQLCIAQKWLNSLNKEAVYKVLKTACTVMGGGERIADKKSVLRFLRSTGTFSLSGARIIISDVNIVIVADNSDHRLRPRREWPLEIHSRFPKLSPLSWKQWRFEVALGIYKTENEVISLIYMNDLSKT